MANLLADPSLWADSSGNAPPAYWTGSQYLFVKGDEEFAKFTMDAPHAMDAGTVSGTIYFSNMDGLDAYLRYVEHTDGGVDESLPIASGQTVSFSFDSAPSGDGYYLFIAFSPDGFFEDLMYGLHVTITPDAPPIVAACDEYGRTTRAYVSGYDRTRVHESRLVRGEKRCLVADFNGAIGQGRTIASARVRTDQNWAAVLSNGRIEPSNRAVAVDLQAGWGSPAWIKVEATLDNGEVYTQMFRIMLYDRPWFLSEPVPAQGPNEIVVSA